MDSNDIINYYYTEGTKLKEILMVHSRNVANLALRCAAKHPELNLNTEIIEQGAMLHDIGIIHCNAPGIQCYGSEHYIRHGIIGGEMLRHDYSALGISPQEADIYARICERHTGTGLTLQQIKQQNLPLPPQDWTPETLEEQLICYADKFFSKTHPEVQKTLERVIHSLEKFGDDSIKSFNTMHQLFQ